MSTPGSMLQGIAKAVVQGAMEIMTAEPKSASRDQTKETTIAEPKTVLRRGDQAKEKEEEKKAKGMETKSDDTHATEKNNVHPISSSIKSLIKDKNDQTEKKKKSTKEGKKRRGRKIKKKNKKNDSSSTSSSSSSSSSSDSDDDPHQQTMNNLFWIGIVGGVALTVLGFMNLPKIKSVIRHARKTDGDDKAQAQKASPIKENNDPFQIIIKDLLE
ncbi:hypothetical protein Sjap_023826 [Stephania japonica]|uniref:Uncharacterized protein n=1 Tax=Stephania japonica TaxID=461633 RepID=A0AAP0ECF2_9MAGN